MDTVTGARRHIKTQRQVGAWRSAGVIIIMRLLARRRSLCPTHYYVNVKRKGKDGGFFVHLYLIQIRMVISEGYSGSAPQVRCSHVMAHF